MLYPQLPHVAELKLSPPCLTSELQEALIQLLLLAVELCALTSQGEDTAETT